MILHWLIGTIAVLIAAYILPGADMTLTGAIVFALVLGILNIFVKPVLHLLALPITILTLGLFSFVINALIVLLAAAIVPGAAIAGFWNALLFALILSLINIIFNRVIPD